MKYLLVAAIFMTAGAAQAQDAHSGSVSCSTKSNAEFNYVLEAKTLQAWGEEEARFKDITMTASSSSDDKETGRAKEIMGKMNPKARKYKEYFNFEMDQLTDVKDFSKFRPIDQCNISVKIPFTFYKKSKFEAPVVTNCDQGGGSVTMICQYEERD